MYGIGERFLGRNIGALSALILVSIPHFLHMTHMGMLDTAISFYFLLVLASFWAVVQGDKRFLLVLGLAIGLGIMTKSVAGLIPLMIILVYTGLNRQWTLFRTGYTIWGLILALLLVLPWHLYMFVRHGQAFLDAYFMTHMYKRMTTIFGSLDYPWNWYNFVLAYEMDFWFNVLLVFLLVQFFFFKRGWLRTCTGFLSFAGIIFMIIISLSQTKHPWYVTPLYPLIALCLASSMHMLIKERYQQILFLLPLAILYSWLTFYPNHFSNDFSPQQKEIGLRINTLLPEQTPVHTCIPTINSFHYYSHRSFIKYESPEHMLDMIKEQGSQTELYFLLEATESTADSIRGSGRIVAENQLYVLLKYPSNIDR